MEYPLCSCTVHLKNLHQKKKRKKKEERTAFTESILVVNVHVLWCVYICLALSMFLYGTGKCQRSSSLKLLKNRRKRKSVDARCPPPPLPHPFFGSWNVGVCSMLLTLPGEKYDLLEINPSPGAFELHTCTFKEAILHILDGKPALLVLLVLFR